MTRLSMKEVRGGLSTITSRVAYRKERVVLVRNGKDTAAIVPLEDLQRLQELEAREMEEGYRAMAEESRTAAELFLPAQAEVILGK